METSTEVSIPHATQEAAPSLPIDEDGDEVDEGYAASLRSSNLTSIASSIRTGVIENGRTYPSYGRHYYGIPTDDNELDRNDLQHAKFTRLIGGLHQAPVLPGVQSILDLGTGTGIWAIDMADAYPSASVVGVDLAPIQPTWIPPNCQFEVDDIEDDWQRAEESCDFIHCRELVFAIRNWDRLLEQSHTHLKPGGWIELGCTVTQSQSDDGSLQLAPALIEVKRLLLDISERMGSSVLAPFQWKRQLDDLGFLNVTEIVRKIPLGPWPKDRVLKEIGALEMANVRVAMEAMLLRGFTGLLGRTREELQVLNATTKKQMMNPNMHSYVF